jgi:hypothetical protein
VRKEDDPSIRHSHPNPDYSPDVSNKPICWWCCHKIDIESPITIPLESPSPEDTPSQGYGCFCSHSCACAYLFREEEMQFRRWERYLLLCEDFQRATQSHSSRVPQAPPRQTLRMFGGPLTIEQFRAASQRDLQYRVLTPSLMHTVAAIQIQESPNYGSLLAAVMPHQSKTGSDSTTTGLRLKRTKPLLDPCKTLEGYIRGYKGAATTVT